MNPHVTDDHLSPSQRERLARLDRQRAESAKAAPPSWTSLDIEKVSRFEPLIVLASAIAEVCVRWWRKYGRRGDARR